MKAQRFLVFGGFDYYPRGGWRDFRHSHETEDEARAAIEADKQTEDRAKKWDWFEIVDTDDITKDFGDDRKSA